MTAGTETRFCVSCGHAVPDAAPFCEGCGAAQALETSLTPQRGTLWSDGASAVESDGLSANATSRDPMADSAPTAVAAEAGDIAASDLSENGAAEEATAGASDPIETTCHACGGSGPTAGAFCESCGTRRHGAPSAAPVTPPSGGAELIALIALSATVVVLMTLHWYTAILGGSAPLDASGWKALTIGRILLLSSSVLIGLAAWSLLSPQAPLARVRITRRDLGHLAISLGALLGAYLVVRVASPPRFYRVTDYTHSYFGTSDDSSVHPQVSVHAPAVLALLAVGGWLLVGLRVALASPEGFSLDRCWAVLREFASSRRRWR